MDLQMIQNILQRVENKNLYVKNTSSSDCKLLEPTDGNGDGYLICKSFTDDVDYKWKIIELDEWKMLKPNSEAYYKKNDEEYNEIEKIYEKLTEK